MASHLGDHSDVLHRTLTAIVILLLVHTQCIASECFVENPLLNKALSKTTYASSPTSPASLTTDGVRSEYDSTCMDTAVQDNPWLVVELQEMTAVSTVVLTAITPYLATDQYQILVGDTFDAATFNPLTSGYEPCISRPVSMVQFVFEYVQCERTLVGRYILIFRQENTNLRVCEVEVYAEQVFQPEKWTCIKPELQGPMGVLNLARGQNTYQSSLYGQGTSPKAVDGNDNPDYNGNSCSHTSGTSEIGYNWWVVDLGETSSITGVVITNRLGDFSHWYLDNIQILVGNVSSPSSAFVASDYQVAVDMCSPQSQIRHYYKLPTPANGNHLAITMYDWLVLCEVEIYAENINDVSFPSWTQPDGTSDPDQTFLQDDDDSTCLVFGSEYPSLRVKPYLVNIPWDPTADGSFKPDLFINITHTANVKILVLVKAVDDVSSASWILQGKACTLIETTENLDLVQTRYTCHCDDKCEVVVQLRGTRNSNVDNSRLCAINVYDENSTIPITTHKNITLQDQALLYDDDDSTCLSLAPKYPSSGWNPVYIEIPWDPTARTGVNLRTGNYYCKQDFYVNVTHTADVEVILTKRGEFVDGSWQYSGQNISLMGVTEANGLVRTRYGCFCDVKCEVLIELRHGGGSRAYGSFVCTVNLYD